MPRVIGYTLAHQQRNLQIPTGRGAVLAPSARRPENPGGTLNFTGGSQAVGKVRRHGGFAVAVMGYSAKLRPDILKSQGSSLKPQAQAAAQVNVGFRN